MPSLRNWKKLKVEYKQAPMQLCQITSPDNIISKQLLSEDDIAESEVFTGRHCSLRIAEPSRNSAGEFIAIVIFGSTIARPNLVSTVSKRKDISWCFSIGTK